MAVHVLFLSYDGLTDALGQSQVLSYMKELQSNEFTITIISLDKPAAYAQHKATVGETCETAGIRWISLPFRNSPPGISVFYMLRDVWKKIKELQSVQKFDIVHGRGGVISILARMMKLKFGTKFIFDMRGWWPDEKLESGAWSGPFYKIAYRYFKNKEREFFAISDYTVSLTEAGKAYIVATNLKNAEKVAVVPTCTDLSMFQLSGKDKRNATRETLGFPADAKILVYSGALGGNYPVKDLFLCIQSFLALSEHHYCLILSKDTPQQVQLPEKTVLLSVPFREVGTYLAACDIGFIFYKKAFSNIGRCPTKMGEYWACGVQVICSAEVGDVEQLFDTFPGTGFIVKEWNKEEITNTFVRLFQNPVSKAYLRQSALQHFALDKGVEFYRNLYRAVHAGN